MAVGGNGGWEAMVEGENGGRREWWMGGKDGCRGSAKPVIPAKAGIQGPLRWEGWRWKDGLGFLVPEGGRGRASGNDGGAVDSRFHGNDRWVGMVVGGDDGRAGMSVGGNDGRAGMVVGGNDGWMGMVEGGNDRWAGMTDAVMPTEGGIPARAMIPKPVIPAKAGIQGPLR